MENYQIGKLIIFRKPREVEIKGTRLAEVDEETILVKKKFSQIATNI